MVAAMMKEEDKIFAGYMFDPRKKELKEIKHKAHEACRRYNLMDEYDPSRTKLMKEILGSHKESFYFQGPVQINYGKHLHIGENFFANFNLTIMDDGLVKIGDNVAIGPNVSIMATNHPLISQERMGRDKDGNCVMAEYAKGISIGNNVWIACNTVIIDGVNIGNDVVIGAGSVVTKDIPDGYLAYGNPCRPIRPITQDDSMKHLVLEEDKKYFSFTLD